MISTVEWTLDGKPAKVKRMSIDHGGFYILVPEKFLDSANVIKILKTAGAIIDD